MPRDPDALFTRADPRLGRSAAPVPTPGVPPTETNGAPRLRGGVRNDAPSKGTPPAEPATVPEAHPLLVVAKERALSAPTAGTGTDILGAAQGAAAAVLLELALNPLAKHETRLAAANDILDRGGNPRASKQEIKAAVVTTSIRPEDFRGLSPAAVKAELAVATGARGGSVIDAAFADGDDDGAI